MIPRTFRSKSPKNRKIGYLFAFISVMITQTINCRLGHGCGMAHTMMLMVANHFRVWKSIKMKNRVFQSNKGSRQLEFFGCGDGSCRREWWFWILRKVLLSFFFINGISWGPQREELKAGPPHLYIPISDFLNLLKISITINNPPETQWFIV